MGNLRSQMIRLSKSIKELKGLAESSRCVLGLGVPMDLLLLRGRQSLLLELMNNIGTRESLMSSRIRSTETPDKRMFMGLCLMHETRRPETKA